MDNYKTDLLRLAKRVSDLSAMVEGIRAKIKIYITPSADDDPALIFGGKWERIKDRFLLAAGDKYAAGDTGGSADMALHSHDGLYWPGGNEVTLDGGALGGFGITGYTTNIRSDGKHLRTASAGLGMAGNMPPYLAIYVWRKIQ